MGFWFNREKYANRAKKYPDWLNGVTHSLLTYLTGTVVSYFIFLLFWKEKSDQMLCAVAMVVSLFYVVTLVLTYLEKRKNKISM